jgi:hypothetical protein
MTSQAQVELKRLIRAGFRHARVADERGAFDHLYCTRDLGEFQESIVVHSEKHAWAYRMWPAATEDDLLQINPNTLDLVAVGDIVSVIHALRTETAPNSQDSAAAT